MTWPDQNTSWGKTPHNGKMCKVKNTKEIYYTKEEALTYAGKKYETPVALLSYCLCCKESMITYLPKYKKMFNIDYEYNSLY